MIYLEHTFKDKHGAIYHQIRIHTACCKRVFIVQDLGDGTFLDIEEGTLCLEGTTKSINQQLEFHANKPN